MIRLRTEGAARRPPRSGASSRSSGGDPRRRRRDPEPHDEIAQLRDEVAELRASARLPSEDLGDALAAVTRAAVDKVAAVRNQVADRHWVPEDAASTGVEQASADRHRAQDDEAAQRTGVEQASPAVDEPQAPAEDPWAPLTTADGRLLVPHGDARDDVGAARASYGAGGRGGGAGGARRALAARDARIAELEARLEARQPAAAPAPVPTAPPAGAWAPLTAPTGDVYWYHTETHETTWERPVPVAAPTPAPARRRAGARSYRRRRPSRCPRLRGPVSTAGGLAAQLELCSALQGLGALLDGPDAAAAPPRPDDAKLEGLVGDLIGALKTDAGKRDFERLAAQQPRADTDATAEPDDFVWTPARPPTPPAAPAAPTPAAQHEFQSRRARAKRVVRDEAPAPDAPARAAVEETRAEAEAEKALRAENARLREEMERAAAAREAENARLRGDGKLRRARNGRRRAKTRRRPPRPRSSPSSRRARRGCASSREAAVASAAARAAADAAAAARCDRAFTAMDAAAQAASEAAAAAALPMAPAAAAAAPTVPAEPASAQHEFQSRRASLKRVAPTPPSPSPLPEPEPSLRPSASSSSLEDQIAAGRRNLRKSPPPSPSPAQNTRKSVESYLAARWRAAATEPDPPLADEAACPLDGGDLGPRLEAFESESIASSTDSSTAASSSVERPRSLLSKARAVNGETRPAPEPAPAPQAPEVRDLSSSDAGSAEPAEDPAVLAAADAPRGF